MPILETIGGSVLSAVIKLLVDRLSSGDLTKFVKFHIPFYKQIKKLKVVLLSVKALVNDAEEKQLTDPAVGEWLTELEEAIRDAEDLVDKINTRVLKSSTTKGAEYVPVKWTDFFTKKETKIVEMVERLEFIARQKENLGLRGGVPATHSEESHLAPLVDESSFYGRDADVEAIVKVLESEDEVPDKKLSVISIIGMGGIGKTTLARIIYNKMKKKFQLSAWIGVCGEFNIFTLTKAILEAITPTPIMDLYDIQVQLEETLKDKKFLFVLDNVWCENYTLWDALKVPLQSAARGSQIIVTTRNENVASIMGSRFIHQLQKISHEASCLLFEKHALDNVDFKEYEDLKKIGLKIVEKCDGLPLAIKSIGGLLRNKLNQEEWEKILNSNIWELSQDYNILSALWLSYHHLPPHLKRCFLFCSIFPKNYRLEEGQLVLLWMAEDLLQPEKGRRIEDVGKENFHALVSRSLFQRSTANQSYVTMHDLVHDLASFMSRGFFHGLDNDALVLEGSKIRHLSFLCQNFDEELRKLEQSVRRKKNYLRSFLSLKLSEIDHDSWNRKELVFPEVTKTQLLRVISLSAYPIVKLPQTIGNLTHLRFFELFYAKVKELPNEIGDLCNLQTLILRCCPNLNGLPGSIGEVKLLRYLDLSSSGVMNLPESVCNLHNLQTLLLGDCEKFTHLPTEFGSLTSLCRLDIEKTSLKEMPPKMGQMKAMRHLTNFILGKGTGSTIKDLGELQYLHGYLAISGLENFTDVGDASGDYLKEKKYLDKLFLRWKIEPHYSYQESCHLEKLQPHTNLKELCIEGYNSGGFPRWVGDVSFSKMVSVSLINCRHCIKLPPLGKLPSLKRLEIRGFEVLEEIDDDFYSGDHDPAMEPFKSVEILYFEKMPKWKNWARVEAEEHNAFPNLKQLYLVDCPNMKVRLTDRLEKLRY